jgi:acyl-CoA synthetase (AMP-forming)/AMP-acid ligase II
VKRRRCGRCVFFLFFFPPLSLSKKEWLPFCLCVVLTLPPPDPGPLSKFLFVLPIDRSIMPFKDGIFTSSFPDVDNIPTGISFSQFILGEAVKHGDGDALVDGPSGRKLSFLQVAGASKKVAAGLVAKGFSKGDCVMVCSPNLPEYALAFHGTIMANGVVSTANPLYTDEELSHQLANSKAKFIVTIGLFVEKIQSAVKLAGDQVDVKEIFVLGDAVDGTTAFSTLLANDGSACPDFEGSDDDTCVLPYSSGTTGLPKGVELTHRNLISNILQIRAVEADMTKDDVLLGLLPMFHIYGMIVILNAGLYIGSKIVTIPKFDPEVFLRVVAEHKCTILHLVPPILLFLAKHPIIDKFDLSAVKLLFCGAAPLGKDLSGAASARLNAKVKQGYGMTELSPVSHINPNDKIIDGAAGVLVPNMQARIVDVESGENQGPGEANTGELIVRGPNVMKGYLNNPEATKDTIDADGWLHTGDIAYADDEGYFFIVDRLKELIKYKGFQVPPAELEALLIKHEKIQDAAVIGVPDEEAGELPRAYVVLQADQEMSESDVQKYVEEHVAPHKRLRGGVEVVTEIPKSASGKILRRVLKAKATEKK